MVASQDIISAKRYIDTSDYQRLNELICIFL